MTLGAGSVRTAEQLQKVQAAGAKFAVSPGSSDALLSKAEELAMPFVPGASTPSEMIALLDKGLSATENFSPPNKLVVWPSSKPLPSRCPRFVFFPTGGIKRRACQGIFGFRKSGLYWWLLVYPHR